MSYMGSTARLRPSQGQQPLTMLTTGHTSLILSNFSQRPSHGSMLVSCQASHTYCIHTYSTDGTYIQTPNPGYVRYANGSTENIFSYSDIKLNTYSRNVSTLNSTVIQDIEEGSLTWDWWPLTTGGNNAHLMVQGLVDVGRLPGVKGRGS